MVRTIGVLVRGARKVWVGARRQRYENWIERDLTRQFDGPAAAADTQIAAVAVQHGLVLVTRNVKDFSRFDLKLLNPWGDAASP